MILGQRISNLLRNIFMTDEARTIRFETHLKGESQIHNESLNTKPHCYKKLALVPFPTPHTFLKTPLQSALDP